MFQCLNEDDLTKVVGAMRPVTLSRNEVIITEGDDGDELFVVEVGKLVCSKSSSVVRYYKQGEIFGELALFFNAPRAATISAQTNCHLWALDRKTFNRIVKKAQEKKRELYH